MPFVLLFTFIFIFVLRYRTKKAASVHQAKSDSFWERERKARFSRKKDISHIDAIQIDFAKLPFIETNDHKLNELQNKVRSFEDKTMVNLSHIDNTDIKLEYGVANFNLISQYDQNYLVFSRYLYEWGKYLYDLSKYDKAKVVLEQALAYGTDISGVFITLAHIYKSNGERDKINDLIAVAETLTSLMKPKILRELTDVLNS